MKIQVERQRNDECLLSSIAAVTGKTLEQIRRMACEIARAKEWSEVTDEDNHPRFWSTVREIGRRLGCSAFVAEVQIGNEITGAPKLPKKGRGVVVIRSQGTGAGHAMPYQSGLVYDPNFPEIGRTLESMMQLWPSYHVEKIVPMKDDSLNRECPRCHAPVGRICRYPSGYYKSESHRERRTA